MTIAPPNFAATRRPADHDTAGDRSRIATAIALALVLAAILPPLAFVVLPDALGLLGPLPSAMSLVAAVVLAPAAVGVVTLLTRLDPVRRNFAGRSDKEHEHLLLRVLVLVLLVVYAFGLAELKPVAGGGDCLVVALLALASGWLFLLHLILSPAPSSVRRNAAIVIDAIAVSAFLHFGGAQTAGWYPLYLAATFYAGVRLGPGALALSAAASAIGFAVAGALSPFWQQQPLLFAGLALALVALPGFAALSLRAIAASRAEAAAAIAARDRFLSIIGRGLREPVEAMMRLAAAAAETEPPAAGWPAHALLSQIGEVVDLATIEAGTFVPPVEGFDLHALVNETVARLRPTAARQGVTLAVRLDPNLPYRLRGWPRQLAQILNSTVIDAIGRSGAGTIRIDLSGVQRDGGGIALRLVVRDHAGEIAAPAAELDDDPFAADVRGAAGAAGGGGFAFAVVKRLVALMGGHITLAEAPGQGRRWTATLPVAVDEAAPVSALDLARRPVLIVTDDAQFAGELAEPLNAWDADTRWVGGLDDALIYVERFETAITPILVVDGRARVLPALSFVHRAIAAQAVPPFVLFVAEAGQIASLAELGDGELTGLLPAPCTERMLEAALHALPLAQGVAAPVPSPTELPVTAPPPEAAESDDRVTPIAAHPRFGSEAVPPVDARVVASLRALDGGFLPELIQSFRADADLLVDRLDAAAAAGDAVAFARALQALRRSASALGGTRLCELAQSLREINGLELRQHGAAIMQRLSAELARLDAALVEFLPAAAERRR